ncbi:glutathione S-transferase [Tropicimonas aquimaris]|uniref:Glutathione S-transferase n=1 Tax=Tropicimonas aquimaris TaxID=914152 RepID=A0ABW3IS72_9RHOB
MTYELFIGSRAYSSWSLRGWLLFERFGLTCKVRKVDFLEAGVAEQLEAVPPARTVPTLRMTDGTILWDSLAIAEELASRHPEAGHWPSDPTARAIARCLAAEMHSGFTALRSQCPMNLQAAYSEAPVRGDLQADLDRIEQIWDHARTSLRPKGPWLCGDYSIADAFYAPVAARIAGYGLPVSEAGQAYVAAHLADPAFRRWRAMGIAEGTDLPWYDRDYPLADWPGPEPIPARAVDAGPSINETCPYSGDPVTDYAEIAGRVIGFCNPFCRDKSVADPAAWPQLAPLIKTM